MRSNITLAILLSSLLAACATTNEGPPNKHISQSGNLKVHPGLLGQPVPPELQDAALASSGSTAGKGSEGMSMDQTGLRTQRSVYFDFDSSAIKPDYEPALKAHAQYLSANPKARVRIEGNADERGAAGYNNALGLKRAETVRKTIIDNGASDKQVVVKSLGEARPKLKGHDEESWAENRRADVVYEREE
jgi:peptidoglycan-associated lipoprotein